MFTSVASYALHHHHYSTTENVDVFTYAGGKENTHGNMDDEVKVRLSEMSAAFAALRERVFLNSNI